MTARGDDTCLSSKTLSETNVAIIIFILVFGAFLIKTGQTRGLIGALTKMATSKFFGA